MGSGFIEPFMESITAILASRGSVNQAVKITLPLRPALLPVIERAQRIALAATQLQLDTVVTRNPYGGELQIQDETGSRVFKFSSVVFEAGLNKQTVLVFSNGTKDLAVRLFALGDHLFQPQAAVLA
jgi:hypothetical protein